MDIFKRNIFIGLILAALFLLLANFDYVRTQVEFAIRGVPRPSETTSLPLDTHQFTPAKRGPSNLLSIPNLGIQAPVQYPPDNREETFQRFLQDGAVHYPGTALPGQPGNVYIFGHSSDFSWSKGDYKAVFALLPKINVGDSITLTDEKGVEFTYTVTRIAVVDAKDMSVLDQRGNQKHLLTLQTSYPIGTAMKRFVAVAELVYPTQKP